MYQQINPTETFRERQLALLREGDNRRLARRLRSERGQNTRSTLAAATLGFLAALVVVAGIVLVALSSPAHASTTFTVDADFADAANIISGVGVCGVRKITATATDTVGKNIPEFSAAKKVVRKRC